MKDQKNIGFTYTLPWDFPDVFLLPFQMVKWSNGKYQVASPNFPEWSAGCPEFDKPSLSVDSNGLSLNFGRQRCEAAVLVVDLFFVFFRPPQRKKDTTHRLGGTCQKC